jgi:hypothetical protein
LLVKIAHEANNKIFLVVLVVRLTLAGIIFWQLLQGNWAAAGFLFLLFPEMFLSFVLDYPEWHIVPVACIGVGFLMLSYAIAE